MDKMSYSYCEMKLLVFGTDCKYKTTLATGYIQFGSRTLERCTNCDSRLKIFGPPYNAFFALDERMAATLLDILYVL